MICRLGVDGALQLASPVTNCDLIADVLGYFVDCTTATASADTPSEPWQPETRGRTGDAVADSATPQKGLHLIELNARRG